MFKVEEASVQSIYNQNMATETDFSAMNFNERGETFISGISPQKDKKSQRSGGHSDLGGQHSSTKSNLIKAIHEAIAEFRSKPGVIPVSQISKNKG